MKAPLALPTKRGLAVLCYGVGIYGRASSSIETSNPSDGATLRPLPVATQRAPTTRALSTTSVEFLDEATPLPGAVDWSFEPQASYNWCGFCPEAFDLEIEHGLLIQPNDKILVGGRGLVRLNLNGYLDASFHSGVLNPGSSVRPVVTDMALQPDGRILICGDFTQVHDTTRRGIARLHPDGRLDESFDPGHGISGGAVKALAWHPSGRVVIVGTFTTVHGAIRRGVAFLHDDGTLDTDFNPGSGATPAIVNSVMLDGDGNVYLAGGFVRFNGVLRRGLVRLQPNGNLDPGLNPELAADLTARSSTSLGPPRLLAVQPDGKIWVTADFGKATNGSGVMTNLVRFDPDGKVDLALALGVGLTPELRHYPLTLALQPDGKLLVSAHRLPVLRLLPDGTRDPGFVDQSFALPGYDPQFIALQHDGRILLAGVSRFTDNLVRLHGNDLPYFPPTFERGSLNYDDQGWAVFRFTAYPGTEVVVEATTSLESPNWKPLQTNSMGILRVPDRFYKVTFEDTSAAVFSQRFYRLVSP